MHRVRARGVLLVVTTVAATLASCTTGAADVRTGSLRWHNCGAVQCTKLSVPLDRAHPTGRRIQLSLARLPARGKRIGVLFTNPGGPGASGTELVQDASQIFDSSVLDRFDIVSWDPRGVGASAPVECADKQDFFFRVDRSNADAATARANVAASKQFVADCKRNSGDLLPYVSTRATVDDMDAIRAAMGERTVNYLGFSYGTYLGALYANGYPRRVRAMVLDGAIDPAQSYDDLTISQGVGFEHALRAFLAWCHRDSQCAFARHGDPTAAFDDLTASLEDETLPGTVEREHRTLGPGEANIGIAEALYGGKSDGGWVALSRALNEAARGDGSALLVLSDAYTERQPGGTYTHVNDAFYAIGCLDSPPPPTVVAVQQLAARAARAAPHFGAATAWLGLPCTLWPVPPDGAVAPVRAAGSPPIVVIGTTNDPATPYASAQALARELVSGRLLTYVGEGHTAYGRSDSCIDTRVDRYLISLAVPTPGTRCK